MKLRILIPAVWLLVVVSGARGEIIDMAGGQSGSSSPGAVLTLSDNGQLWGHSKACDTPDWRLIATVPDAIFIGGGVGQGAIMTTTEVTHFTFSIASSPPIYVVETVYAIPAELTNPVAMTFANSSNGGLVVIRTGTGEFWHLFWVTSGGHSWRGPCGPPPEPVSIEKRSFGEAKALFRR